MRIKWQDQIGKTINNFKIVGYERRNKKSYINAICPMCGRKFWLRADSANTVLSCGCYNKQNNIIQSKDITGLKSGRLTALKATCKRDCNGSVMWECPCSCGNTALVSAHNLIDKRVRSCGCLRKDNSKVTGNALGESTKNVCVNGTNIRNLTSKVPKNNTSGIKGVSWDNSRKLWVAQIAFKGTHYNLGRYKDIKEAEKARKVAEDNMYGNFLEWYKQYRHNI